ncbi:hypothetical protein BDW69DRAFT_188450 [Aspergillus filifer]
MRDVWPAFYLEGLRTLRLFQLDPDGLSSLFNDHSQRPIRNAQHLHIVTKRSSLCKPEDVAAILNLPAHLKSLSLNWCDRKTKTEEAVNGKRRNIWKIRNHQVLNQRSSTLEYLDILHEEPSQFRNRPDHFGPLKHFTRLKYLSTSSEALIYSSETSLAPSSLKDALTTTLKTLVLSIDIAGNAVRNIVAQLEKAVLGPARSQLRSIEIRDTLIPTGQQSTDPAATKYQPVSEACAHHAIRFRLQSQREHSTSFEIRPFLAGSLSSIQWEKTCELRQDGEARYYQVERKHDEENFLARLRDDPQTKPIYLATHALLFQDHRGNKSFMVFEVPETEYPLPPLVQFAIYFTHIDGHSSRGQPEELKADLKALTTRSTAVQIWSCTSD